MKSRYLVVSLLVILALLTITISGLAASTSQSNVYRFDLSMVANASATLTRNSNHVSMTFKTTDLEPGAAYTVWFVVFNHPENCVAPIPGISTCGEGDIFDANGDLIVNGDGTFGTPGVDVAVIYAAGHVINGKGTGNFGGALSEGVPTPNTDVVFGSGMHDAETAEVHLVARTHGDPIPGMVNEQINTFAGGCAINNCVDQQFAVFVP